MCTAVGGVVLLAIAGTHSQSKKVALKRAVLMRGNLGTSGEKEKENEGRPSTRPVGV
jgi:hypothetical protein